MPTRGLSPLPGVEMTTWGLSPLPIRGLSLLPTRGLSPLLILAELDTQLIIAEMQGYARTHTK